MQWSMVMPTPAGMPLPAQVPPSSKVALPSMSTFQRMAEMLELSIRVDMAADAAKPKWVAKSDRKVEASPAHRPAKRSEATSSGGPASSNARWQGASRGQHRRRPSRSPPWHRKREPAWQPKPKLTGGPQSGRAQTHGAPTDRPGQGQPATPISEGVSGEEPGSGSGPAEKSSEQPLERLAAVAFGGDLFRDVSQRSCDTGDESTSDRSEVVRRGPVGTRAGSRARSQAAHPKDTTDRLQSRKARHRKTRRHAR